MSDIEWLVNEVENGPQGPEVGAFFDFDGTLIDGFSAVAFFRERIKAKDISKTEIFQTIIESVNVERRGHDVSVLMDIAVGAQKGKPLEDMQDFGRRIFKNKIADMVYPDSRTLINAHLTAGHTVVLASSATNPQVEAAAEDLGIEHILCTEMEEKDGILTGVLASPIRWGEAKADAVKEFAAEHNIDLDQSYAYSNGAEDVPFLETSGHSRPLNPDSELVQIAEKKGWPTAFLVMPHRHNPITRARSYAAMGALGFGVALGAGVGILNRDRSLAMKIAASMGPDLALAVAGVKVNVIGEENLWSHRPAVFLFNHQSQLDVLMLGTLLRKDFTGVAKKQLEHDPLFAPLGYLADVAYIDRSNSEKAHEQLQPALEALENGRSLAIAPEGTRSPTPKLLPFKKGGFFMAMQAGVPVVPIVIRNAGDIMRPHSNVISNGTVDVAVLKPISTKTWTRANLGKQVEKVRNQYLETLAHWPHS